MLHSFLIVPVLVTLAVCSASLPAAEDELLFSDDFATLQPGWGQADSIKSVSDNRLVVTPELEMHRYLHFQGKEFFDGDFRATVTKAKGSDAGACGLLFWGTDNNNCYLLTIFSNGTLQVTRRMQGTRLSTTPNFPSAALKKGIGQTNRLRVVTQGTLAKVYVNDQEVIAFRGFPPFGGSKTGIHCGSDKEPSTWAFSEFRVSKAPPAPAQSAHADDLPIFADDFATLDPAWGLADERHFVSGNKMVVTPKADLRTVVMYGGTKFGDADIRVRVTQEQGAPDPLGGILFWATDLQNYYAALVQSDGRLHVQRRTNGKSLALVKPHHHDELKPGLGQANDLRVVTAGNVATILINGQQVVRFRGFPPVGTSQVGLAGSSGKELARWAFDDFSVRHPAVEPNGPAQEQTPPLLADDFKTLAPAWGASDLRRAENGRLLISPKADTGHTVLHTGGLFGDADIRLNVSLAEGGKNGCAGLIFWAQDASNCYAAQIYPHGNFRIGQKVAGKWASAPPVPLAFSPAVRTGLHQTNQLRVITRGNKAAVYFNGQQVAAITGTPPALPAAAPARAPRVRPGVPLPPPAAAPPQAQSKIGLYCESGAEPYTWAFSDFVVRPVPASLPQAPAPDDTLLFADDFHDLDPAWGVANDGMFASENKLVLKPTPNIIHIAYYNGAVFDDADVRVKLSAEKGETTFPVAGIAFWQTDSDNYYLAQVRPDGLLAIRRTIEGKNWFPFVTPPGQAALKQGIGQANEIRVVTQGKFATLFINNREVTTIEGVPPEGGGMVGLGGTSGNAGNIWAFSEFSVRKVPADFAFNPTLKAVEEPPLKSAAEYLARAKLRFDVPLLEEGLLDLNKAVELEPRSAEAYAQRGKWMHLYKRGDLGNADLDKAIELNPRYALAYVYRAVLNRIANHDIPAAQKDIERALEIDPKLADAYNQRTLILKQEQRDYAAAVKDLDRAIELAPSDVSYLTNRAGNWYELREYEKALADLAKAVRINPRVTTSYNLRALIRKKQGDRLGTLEDYNQLIELDATSGLYFANRAVLREELGDMAGALADIARAVELDPREGMVLGHSGDIRLAQGDFSSALANYSKAIELLPTDESWLADRAYCRIWTGDYAAALADTTQALRLNPYYQDTYVHSALARRFQGDLDGAIADLSRAIEIRPKEPKPYSYRGFARLANRDAAGAAADFESWIGFERNLPNAYLSRACANWLLGQTAAAENDFDQVLALWPDWERKIAAERDYLKNSTAAGAAGPELSRRAASRLRRGDFYGAMIDVTQLLKQNPQSTSALLLRAEIGRELGYRQWALADLDKALQIDPRLAEACSLRGQLLVETFQPAEALAQYNKAIELEPRVALHYQRRGQILAGQDEKAKAIADFDKAIELDPELGPSYVGRGRLRALAKEIDQALEDYDRAVELAPSDVDARLVRGELRRAKKYYEDSVADFGKAIELSPRSAEAFKGRGVTYLAMDKRDEARRDFDEAALIRPSWEEELDKVLTAGPAAAAATVVAPAATPTTPPPVTGTVKLPGLELYTAGKRARLAGDTALAKKLLEEALVADPRMRTMIERELAQLGSGGAGADQPSPPVRPMPPMRPTLPIRPMRAVPAPTP